jgi:IclR family transcriptional regulator, KDG regulon repressor
MRATTDSVLPSPSSQTGISRDLSILRALGDDEAIAHGGLGVVRVAQIVGREKSQVSRALRALEECGLVERDPISREYRLGWQIFSLAARVADRRLLQEAQLVLRMLASEIGETAHLCRLAPSSDGESVVLTLLSVPPPHHAFRASGWEGRTVPARLTSAGRVMLIDETVSELTDRFRGTAVDASRPDITELAQSIAIAKRDGYATVDEEFEPGLVGASAPVRDFTGRIVAAINVSAPKVRVGRDLTAIGVATKLAAQQLSTQLGQR